MSRRGFLRAGAVVGVAGTIELLGGRQAWAETCDGVMGTVPPAQRSIQLFTLIAEMSLNAGFTLQQLYGIGYRRVEHAGFGSAGNAAAFKAACAGAGPEGIVSSSGHQGIAFPFNAEAFGRTLADAKTVGQKFIVSPSTNAASLADWKAYAKALNTAGALAVSAGLAGVGHHNHQTEYRPISDAPTLRPIDVLIADCDPELTTQEMDLCWVWAAGVDPVTVLEKYPNRFRQFHVKDLSEAGAPTYPGYGVIDFNRIFQAAARTQQIEEYIIEQDAAAPALLTAQLGWDLLDAARFSCPAAQSAQPPTQTTPPAAGSGGSAGPTDDGRGSLPATGSTAGAALTGLATLAAGALMARSRRMSGGTLS